MKQTDDTPSGENFATLLSGFLPDKRIVDERREQDRHKTHDDRTAQAPRERARRTTGRRGNDQDRQAAGTGTRGKERPIRKKGSLIRLEGTLRFGEGTAFVVPDSGEHGQMRVRVRLRDGLHMPGDRVAVDCVARHGTIRGRISATLVRSTETVNLFLHARRTLRGKTVFLGTAPADRALITAGGGCTNFLVEECLCQGRPLRCGDVVRAVLLEERADVLVMKPLALLFSYASVAEHERLVQLNHGAPRNFSALAAREAAKLLAGPAPALADRLDLRDKCLVTLDGADARDFDDAVCAQRLPKGGFELTVAIADVSHYVRTRTSLNREAMERCNSWYFPSSVAPMLPFELSTNLCSLVPGKDRLAVCVRVRLDEQGRVQGTSFDTALMRSQARLTYDEALELVERDDGPAREKFAPARCGGQDVRAMLLDALDASRLLKKNRLARGALDFDLPDPVPVVKEDSLVDLRPARRHDMHCLVEEFMICANEAVAEFLQGTELPFLYRVHPSPPESKLSLLATDLIRGGLLPRDQAATLLGPKAVFRLMGKFRGTAAERAVARLCVCSLPLARYSDVNVGHFGLASRAYCHFTSPIRRCADLLVHRVLKTALGKDEDTILAGRRLRNMANRLNEAERAAQLAEREMDRRLACLWLLGRDQRTIWPATIVSITPHGVRVRLDEAPVEGDLWLDLRFGARHRSLVLGSAVSVRLARFNLVSLDYTFAPVSMPWQKKGVHRQRTEL